MLINHHLPLQVYQVNGAKLSWLDDLSEIHHYMLAATKQEIREFRIFNISGQR